jgi:hypothetical protein
VTWPCMQEPLSRGRHCIQHLIVGICVLHAQNSLQTCKDPKSLDFVPLKTSAFSFDYSTVLTLTGNFHGVHGMA